MTLVKKLDWDSEYFGFNVAYVQQSTLTQAEQQQIEEFVQKEDIRLLQYLCNCHDRNSVLVAEEAQYSFVDIRFTFTWNANAHFPEIDTAPYRAARAVQDDIPVLRAIAHDAYKDSRYYYDGNFDTDRITNFYQEWVEKGVHGTLEDYVHVLYDEDTPIAFCSIQETSTTEARIGLLGVDAERRGRGIASTLMSAVLQDLRSRGITNVTVVTQGRNYAAQRLYQKFGFTTDKMELWYHKWYA